MVHAVTPLVCAILLVAAGCTQTADKKGTTGKAGASKTAKAEAGANGAEAADAEPASYTDGITVPEGKVLLGSPELTAGIPGDGDLTVEQIKAWVDDPKNHETLDIALPLGLDAGLQAVKGLDANPLTRAKIELGRQLYFDTRLSSDGTISCASCHDPEQGYAAHTQFGVGVRDQMGGRNSPVSYNRIQSALQFWDGRAASLEEQAKGPIANPIEMANTHEQAVATVKGIEGYPMQFDKVFGDDSVNIDNIAKAIASFERAIVTGPSPFDFNEKLRGFAGQDLEELKKDDPDLYKEYEALKALADAHPMSESAKRGREIFFTDKGSCTACHVGPNLADELYHNLGVGMDATEPDLGRYNETKQEKDKGAFKTPTVRNVALSAPYMHNGAHKTLEEVVEWYDKGGHPNPTLDAKIKKLNLTAQDKQDLVAFMHATTGAFPKVERGRLPK
ncbi:MAG: c-type cytochrome [Planctomycetia bacterium]|nr:c-type cytochrome [Planctomycetia bacterium]